MDITIVAEEFYNYSLYIKGYSKDTIKRYVNGIKFFRKFTNVIMIDEITEEMVRAFFFYGRTRRKWTSGTYITYHMSLVVFFRWCVKQHYMKSNPAEQIEKPRLEKRLPPKLTKQDALRLLEVVYNFPYQSPYVRYRNHALFAMFLFAGLRRGELLRLNYADVDIENLSIFVRQGKGSKDRIIPMSTTLAQSLSRYLIERKRLNKTCPEFFASLILNKGLTEDGLKHVVLELRRASGMRFALHKLRHTFATLMLEGGCDIYSLSKMMGHSDIKTTTLYLAASAEHLRGQMTKHPLNNLVDSRSLYK